MYNNQKKILKGYLFLYTGLFLCFGMIAFIPIYSNVLNNFFGDIPIFIAIIIFLFGISIIFISARYNIMLLINYKCFISPCLLVSNGGWFIQGVPNNKKQDFKLYYSNLLKEKLILFIETKKGVYECSSLNIKFDMKKWIRKKYYIYEYLITLLQCELSSKKIYHSVFLNSTKNVSLVFKCISNKESKINLVKKGHTHISFLYKMRMRKKYEILSTYSNKDITKLTINDFYHFN